MTRAGLSTERVVRAGAELADQVGFDRVTLSALARHFDVQTASLYSHVAGSEDLHTRIALLALAELADLSGAALAGRSGKDALAALGAVHRGYAREHPGRYDAARLRLDPETAATSTGARNAELLRAVLRGYHLAEPEQTHAVRLLGATLRGYVDLERGGGFDHSTPSSQESWLWVIDALDALLRSWGGPKRT